MIFLTVGNQLPFDRLVRAIDEWAGRSGRSDVVAQIGKGDYQPRNLRAAQFLEPPEFQRLMKDASAVVAHAGIGTILRALELGKPLLVVPRRAHLRETRNDHQVDTTRYFSGIQGVLAAYTEDELWEQLARLDRLEGSSPIGPRASDELLARIRAFAIGTGER